MAYKPRSWRNSLGEPLDALADDTQEIRTLVEQDSGRHENLATISRKQSDWNLAVIERIARMEAKIGVLESTGRLLMGAFVTAALTLGVTLLVHR